jgi:hypothetical protein
VVNFPSAFTYDKFAATCPLAAVLHLLTSGGAITVSECKITADQKLKMREKEKARKKKQDRSEGERMKTRKN